MRSGTGKPLLLTCIAWTSCLFMLMFVVSYYQTLNAQVGVATSACSGSPQWCVVSSPNQNAPNMLKGVVVLNQQNAWAIGVYSAANPGGRLLAERWDGNVWQLSSPGDEGIYDGFGSVAARSPSDVWAVGSRYDALPFPQHTLVKHWDGSAWHSITSTDAMTASNGGSIMLGVAASSNANSVWAVGAFNTNGNLVDDYTLIEQCTTSCIRVPSPNGNYTPNTLNAVAVLSDNEAWAVGYYSHLSGSTYERNPAVQHWDGTSWTTSSFPIPGDGVDAFLNGVDVYSSNDVWAVGSWYDDTTYRYEPLVGHWNGQAWSIVTNIGAYTQSCNLLHSVFVDNEYEVWAVGDSFSSSTAGCPELSPNFADVKPDNIVSQLIPSFGVQKKPSVPTPNSYTVLLHWHGSSLNDIAASKWDLITDNSSPGSQLFGLAAPISPTVPSSLGGKLPITTTWAVGSYTSTNAQTLVENVTAPTNPSTSVSYYVNSMDKSTFYNTGYCAVSNSKQGLIILDYGRPVLVSSPNLYGTKIFDSSHTSYSTNAISTTAEQFISGYNAAAKGTPPPPGVHCSPSPLGVPPVTIALGTSNDVESDGTVNAAHASAWATMVKDIQNYSLNFPEITVVAATDIEPSYSSPAQAIDWVSGYSNSNAGHLYNYGSTNNYPCEYPGIPLPSGLQCAGLGGIWTADKFYTVSYGILVAYPLPQIYHNLHSLYWYQVARWGIKNYGTLMRFKGELTECGSANCASKYTTDYTPDEAWQSLWIRLNDDPGTVTGSSYDMGWSTDIQCIEPSQECKLEP